MSYVRSICVLCPGGKLMEDLRISSDAQFSVRKLTFQYLFKKLISRKSKRSFFKRLLSETNLTYHKEKPYAFYVIP